MMHKTPTKVTFEFADGTREVYDNVDSNNTPYNSTKVVLEARAYQADKDTGSSSTWDKRFTALLWWNSSRQT